MPVAYTVRKLRVYRQGRQFASGDKKRDTILQQVLSGENTSVNCLKIDFRRENFREFVAIQRITPTSAVSNCLKMYVRRENLQIATKT